jgi:Lrp/AsnC family transcriptional regulator, regulator for asnA, asnC and gidA
VTAEKYPSHLPLGPVAGPVPVDELDRRIIEALQEDGRASFRQIATALGVSEATIRGRYRRLCAANALQVVGVTNPLSVGFDAIAALGVKVSGSPVEIAAEVAEWREATYVVLTAGQFDLLVELVCVDRNHLLDVITRIRSLDGVISTEAFVYLALVKQLHNWGTRETERKRVGRAGRKRTARG